MKTGTVNSVRIMGVLNITLGERDHYFNRIKNKKLIIIKWPS